MCVVDRVCRANSMFTNGRRDWNWKEKLGISTNFDDNNQVYKKSILLKILCN